MLAELSSASAAVHAAALGAWMADADKRVDFDLQCARLIFKRRMLGQKQFAQGRMAVCSGYTEIGCD
ncbi:hypothetical protein SB780_38315, partial [Burkholderia sp. SIMBA_057]